ncbi:MAG: reverse transcriptase family protein, partial [Candidatus Thiodiazotropha endolucinida]|nr:reverse transcriptase family protein [Candidatus Thiodiazotropha taylori]MCW4271922.1 reverse transcriptase family protein [Candidatus Thiodiazotropha endolucinida]
NNSIIVDEQNGFRKNRSTIDHLSTLTNIIDARKKMKQSTFAAFIDFRKAYDYINRDILWKKLFNLGIKGKMLSAVQSLYASVSSCVRINSKHTDWFTVKSGLRQGCILSPLLFNLYINDLALYLKSFDIGIEYGSEKLCLLLYADDIVLVAKNERDLQCLINALNSWCSTNDMSINSKKSQIVHFRPLSVNKTLCTFTCGNESLEVVDRYMYLGLMLQENLDYNITVKIVAQSASRALGLLIAKCKSSGGLPYNVFTHLYDATVWPTISYGSTIWGYRSYSCINAVQYRAMRFFLGVGRYTPNIAVSGEMGWVSPEIRQWKSISLHLARTSKMFDSRVNKRIALWASSLANRSCKNWFYHVYNMLRNCDMQQFCDINNAIPRTIAEILIKKLQENHNIKWLESLNSASGPARQGGNKLRTYRLFKNTFEAEMYCKLIMPPRHRAAFSKFRCGVAPIRIETGRYENLNVSERKCPFCDKIEDESHVLLDCFLYDDLRQVLFDKARSIDTTFNNMSKNDQLVFIFTESELIRSCAKTCFNILQRRLLFLCK